MSLTPEQVHFFRHNGFVRLPGILPEAQVAELTATIRQHLGDGIEPIVRDRQGRAVRISDLWGRGSPFREAMTSPLVLEPLADLLGPNIELVLNRHNHATLRLAGEGTSYFHRDVLQWSRPIVTVLTYLEETNLENGCTWIVPGTHLLPGRGENSLEKDPEVVGSGLLEQRLPVPMPAGGLLAINSLLYHTAGENRTDRSRMSMTVGYHSVDELAGAADPKRALVRGERFYKGNDR